MKDNIGISFGIQGMERQNFQHLDDEKVFTFQRNGNLETDENSIGLTNEHSNLLCSRFKPNFKVIGHKVDMLYNKVYFFLTNVDNGVSEIGFIKFNKNVEDGDDIVNQCGCNKILELGTSLENLEQTEYCKYETLLTDCCNEDVEGLCTKCLNFDVNYPINDIEIKHEVLGTMLLFTDGLNPPRYINIDDLEQYKTKHSYGVYQETINNFYKPSVLDENINCVKGSLINCSEAPEIVDGSLSVTFNGECKTCIESINVDKECECSENIECKEDICLDCDKIRIFPLFEIPSLKAEKVQFGGRLKMGTYEFAIAYCDKLGNERSSYYSFTNKIKIFDEESAKFGNEKGEEITNYGIRLEASDLDKRFSYYKVMVIQTTSSNATTSVFEEGIHPITDTEIIYTSDVGLKPSTINKLYLQKPSFKTWNGLTVANNYLFGYGYTKEEEWNLQPIGVLMGAMLQWQTDVASEKLYLDGIGNESTTGYMRDEVYPLSFRVHTDYGYTSPLVNLVGRPANQYDLDIVTNKTEVQTIFEGVGDCAEVNRKHRWQFYNTASELGTCSDYNSLNGELVRKKVEDSCVVPVSKLFEKGTVSITETENYINLIKYIEEHLGDICDPKSVEYYNPYLCGIINHISDETCEPEFSYPICDTNCDINYCDVPELVAFDDDKLFKNDVVEVTNEQLTFHDKDVSKYEQHKKTDYCMIAESDDYSSSIDYVTFENITGITDEWKDQFQDLMDKNDRVWNKEVFITDLADREPLKIIRKTYVEYNDCNTSMSLDAKLDFYFTNIIERDKNKLISKRKSRAIGKFTEDLGKNALWYNVEFIDDDFKIIEIAIGLKDSGYKDSTVGDNIVRVSLYDSCGASANLVDMFTVKLEEGKIFKLNKKDFRKGVAYIALDTELKTIKTDVKYNHRYGKFKATQDYPDTSEKYINASTSFCSYIQVREKEYDSIDITFDTLSIEKTLQYETTCTYIIPKLNECIAQPYKHGKFGYWESTDEYPNNNELYNSKKLKVKPSDILGYEKDFEKYFKRGLDSDGNYILNDNANVTCKPIRHFKFPDNIIAPFMEYENSNDPFSDSRIYPLGVKFDKDLIERFLNIATNNGLITKKQRESITDVEFFRGDRRIHKSILYKGIANDMYKDEVRENTYFRNFPYNSLGKNDFLSTSENRSNVLDHPFKSRGNDRFSVIAPELYYNLQSQNPSEISIEGYMYGHSFGSYKEVEDHSKWVILGSKLTKLAKRFATLETSADIAMGASMLADAFNGFRIGVVGNPMTPASIALGVVTNVLMIASKVATSAKYTITWLNSFKDMGSPHNFASMYISPKGWYNSFKPNTLDNNKIRGLKNRVILKPGVNQINENSYITRINNRERETSLYLYLGNGNELNYPSNYINYDNSSTNSSKSSRYVPSTVSNEYGVESVRNIASPYFSLKNFIPNQYGKIDGVKWLSTGKKIKLKYNIGCETIFGGDITISRISLKNKVPFFNVNAMKLANRTPIKYSLYSNLAHSTYYCDYDSFEESLGISDLPVLNSKYNFDGIKSSNSRYISDPAKFFLFMYGIPTFLVESEINGNFRYHGTERHEQYAERVDVYDWVQEKNTPIAYNNIFYYNNIFSTPQTSAPSRILSGIYSKKDYAKLSNLPNGIVYSQPDNSEISLDNPWLVFKPYDESLFKTDYGQLIKMKGIESEQVLGVFENNSVVFNAVDTLRDRITTENEELGTSGIFATRPMEFTHNELGDTGSQHSVIISTEFGHFTVDAKRGKVNLIQPNAKGLNVISDMRGDGGESGMRKWFKRHLPFKIHKHNIKGLTELDTDNPFKGIGILAWWDSTFKRLFITKKDYIPKFDCIEYKNKEFYINLTECNNEPKSISCPEGFEYDNVLKKCVKKTVCEYIEQPIISCNEGYEYNIETNACEKGTREKLCRDGFIYDTLTKTCIKKCTDIVCPEGFTYNPETKLCESKTVCSKGIDMVFIVDGTASQQGYIDGIKSGIVNNILPSLIEKSQNNYRLGLLNVTDNNSSLYDILTPMSVNNVDYFRSSINSIKANGGLNAPEPMDLALNSILGNSPAVNRGGAYVNDVVVGEFRTDAEKVVFYITDSHPSGYDDTYTEEDAQHLKFLGEKAKSMDVKIYTMMSFTSEIADVVQEMRELSQATDGKYYWIKKASDISNDIVDVIINQIDCTETSNPIDCTEKENPINCNCVIDKDVCACIETMTANKTCSEGYTFNESKGVCQKTEECIFYEEPIIEDDIRKISLQDETYFKNVSWTVAYSALYQCWVSYYDFIPDYAITYPDYFQTGLNFGKKEELGVWSHLLTNKSFQVFYGKKYPWEIEIPIKNTYTGNYLKDLKIWSESKRYINDYDFSIFRKNTFNKGIIYNNTNNSGELNFTYEDSMNRKGYPKKISNTSQEIAVTHFDNVININYFYNRVMRTDNHLNVWEWDSNEIYKSLNPNAISMTSKRVLERLRGDWFTVRLIQDKNTQFKHMFKWMQYNEKSY